MPTLSLVTGAFNRPDALWRLINSIVKRTLQPWELIVADASKDDYPYPYPHNVRFLREVPRLGHVKGYNRAFRETQSEYVIWLGDDVEVMPGYDWAATAFMSTHPEIGLGALYYAEAVPPFKVNTHSGMVYANFGIIRRSIGMEVGWFDEDLTMYGADNALTYRVLRAGYGVASIPKARLWHHVVIDSGKIDNQKYREPDSIILREKYEKDLPAIRSTYQKHQRLCHPLVIGR